MVTKSKKDIEETIKLLDAGKMQMVSLATLPVAVEYHTTP